MDAILRAMAHASVGHLDERVALSMDVPRDDITRMAEALNVLLGDLERRTEDLQASEARYRETFLRAPMGVAEVSVDGKYLRVNERFARMLGAPPGELEGRTVSSLTHPEDRGRAEHALGGLLSGEPAVALTKRYLGPQGRVVHARVLATLQRDDAGRPVRLIKHVEDLTPRLRAEAALMETMERLDLVLERTGVGLWSASLPVESLVLTERARVHLGLTGSGPFTKDEVMARIHPDHRAAVETALAEVHRQRRDIDLHVRVLPAGWMRIRGQRLNGGGTLPRLAAVTWDTTRDVNAAEELKRMRDQLAANERAAAMGSLVSGVAHEIRTPLAYISNNVHLVLRRSRRAVEEGGDVAKTMRELAKFAEAALEGVDRVGALVNDLRRYGRAPARSHQEAMLDELVADAARLFAATNRGHILLRQRLRPTGPLVGDTLQVQQVVLNLLQNAAEAMPEGGRVDVQTTRDGEDAVLVVEDEGPGVAPDVVGRMFDPLVSTKHEGTGLGLNIVRRIVEAHGGRIAYAPSAAGGARFCVRFPLATKG